MSTSTRTPPIRVGALRTLSLVLAFTAAVGLIFGTAGFTAMEADRGLAVNVTSDTSAYLGYEPLVDEDMGIDENDPTEIVEFRNQFGVDLTDFHVDVSAHDPDVNAEIADPPESLLKGTKGRITVTLHCDVRSETEVPLEFSVNGSGGDVSVSLNRTVTVTCIPKTTVTGVTFNNAANADVGTKGPDGGVPAHVWLASNPPNQEPDELMEVRLDGAQKLDTSKPVRPQVNGTSSVDSVSGNWKIAAIEFPDQGVTYVHPNWDEGTYTSPKTSNGVAYNGTVDEEFLLNATVENGEVIDTRNDDEDD